MNYATTLERARLALGTAKVLEAPLRGNPTSADQAKALGEALAHLLEEDQRLEARCLATELDELANGKRDRFSAPRLKFKFKSVTKHVGADVAVVACLLAGFFDVNVGSHLAADWRDYGEVDVGESDVVEIPATWEWTGRAFEYEL